MVKQKIMKKEKNHIKQIYYQFSESISDQLALKEVALLVLLILVIDFVFIEDLSFFKCFLNQLFCYL